ncbi:ABC transporter [Entomohabitans teleogrylli]|uniref:ABC transporter n=1 Tax=Entomohabitans teleogrylli TaxID=1384589 RepID=UPI00073DABF0|nr:ABC transporter [Entomohabitans teleogrylli]
MARFLVVWCVFSVKNTVARLGEVRWPLAGTARSLLRLVLRYGHMPTLLAITHGLCRLRLLGWGYRDRSAVATQNFRCLTGQPGRIDAAWIAMRRQMLELGATWGQNPACLRQVQACISELEQVVAPLHQQNIPVVLAPLHAVSDIIAAMVGSAVTPGRASVVVSSSVEQAELFNQHARELGGVELSYCSIHQDNKQLAGELMSLISDVADGRQNMIIFPDITPDYTIQTDEAHSGKIACRLFGRTAKLHSGVARLSRVVAAQVVFYHLSYQNGLTIKIHPPVTARQVAATMPAIIENTLRDYPGDWLLWHSHSLYFINH